MRISRSYLPIILSLALVTVSSSLYSQTEDRDKISVRSSLAGGNVYFLDCVDGFGGGNVAASVGDDGILLVDDMYAFMVPKLEASLKLISNKPIRMVINSHFHGDHIQGNAVLGKTAIVIAHENVSKQLMKDQTRKGQMPSVTFTDRTLVNFNGEEIQVIHFPNSHTDGDAMIYFTKSKIIHLGDMFFFGMFPAVYTQGGGDIKGLIVSLERVLQDIPADVKVIPGHGELANMRDLADYVAMLKETTGIVEAGILKGKSLEKMREEKVLAKYDALGSGGAQTTDEYLTMLYKLLGTDKK